MNNVTGTDLVKLFVLAFPVAAIAWTVTHEELFGEIHDYCAKRCETSRSLPIKKFFYLFTCEYCFSHYVAAGVLFATGFRLLFADWRGWLIAWFALVWIANHFIAVYGRLKLGIRSERLEIGLKEAVSEQAVTKLDDRESTPRKAS
jgi:hypothetical protein